jgi:hypothetical protein
MKMALTGFQVAHSTGWVDSAQARGVCIPTGTHAPITLIKIEPLVPRYLVEIAVLNYSILSHERAIHERAAKMRSVKTA